MILLVRLFVLLLGFGCFSRVWAHPSVAEIAATWTGLERAGDAPDTRQFTLELRVATGANPVSAGRQPPTGEKGEPLTGTWTSQTLTQDRRGRQAAAVVERVEAEYFPIVGILRITRHSERGGPGRGSLIVFDPDGYRLAGVHTGALRALTPFVAVRGPSLDADLGGIIGAPRIQGAPLSRATPTAASGETPLARSLAEAYLTGDYARINELLNEGRRSKSSAGATAVTTATTTAPAPSPVAPPRDYQKELLALNQQMQEAARAKDIARINQLTPQIREVRSEMAKQLRQGPGGKTPAVANPAPRGAPCPEHIVAWIAQLTALGGSAADFEGPIPASNLFRPRFFAPHFGKTFSLLTGAEKAAIARDLQTCRMNGTPFGNGSLIDPLIGALQNTPGFDAAEAGLGGLALEVISDWNLRSVRDLDAEMDPARVADYELKSTQLVANLLPREREETRQQLAGLKSRNHGRRLLAEVEGLGRAASAGDVDALRRLVGLMAHADALKISATDRAALAQRQTNVLNACVAELLTQARTEVLALPAGMDQLLRGKAWLATQGEAVNLLRQRPDMRAFLRDFTKGRADSYTIEEKRLTREVEAISSMEAAWAFGAAYVVYLDAEASPVWRELDARRHAKLREFERREFLARTGDGPFGPDYPGARYLNALWRNDQQAVEEMDRQWRAPFLAQLNLLDQVDYTPDLVERFSGGAPSADQQRRLRRAIASEASLANGLLVAFAYAFEEFYPKCMDANPKEVRILVHHERIVRNLMGLQLARRPDGTSTIVHRINHRHYPAVQDLGIADPNDRLVSEALLGRSGSPVSQARVGEGLARAMKDHACDSEAIRRIEAGLLARWETFSDRKRAIRQRILGTP